MKNYGEHIKAHRLINGKTLLDVEKATGINNANLSRWERGEVLPNIDFCVKLADYYGITLDELVGRDIPEPTTAQSKTETTASYNFEYRNKNTLLKHSEK